ncbi:MAG: AraC family transcriptional regulator [Oscillospiraceae bacterium]|nr:AraC family transcriptional regulator [Oscillospiraceae bacterium]
MKIYNAVKFILEFIETNLDKKFCIACLAKETGLSAIHLQRVFMMTFNVPLVKYIRLRKLSASLKKLAFYDYRIIDIAGEYGFEHEQSYIRAFKREFGITPGQFKTTGAIIKTTPPFTMDVFIDTSDGILFTPDLVIIPEMFVIGDVNHITREESVVKAPRVAREFWDTNRCKVKNAIDENVYIGLTRLLNEGRDSVYLSGMQTSSMKDVPDGMAADRLPPSEYLRFCYIGKHHYYDLNQNVMKEMYKAIDRYARENKAHLVEGAVYFERIDGAKYDGTYCYLEWFTPVSAKP